jgi:putative membrane protein
MTDARAPIVIDLEDRDSRATPADVAPVPEPDLPERAVAMEHVTAIANRKGAPLLGWFLGALGALTGFMVSVALWDFAVDLLARNIWLGRLALGLLAVTLGALVLMAGRELASLSRLRKIDSLRARAGALQSNGTLSEAQKFSRDLVALYKGRADQRWGVAELADHRAEVLDADALLLLSETTLLVPLDKQASAAVETAARSVATATAIVPLALVDVAVALAANVRMIGQIARIYGGRSGTLGSWRLIRGVAAHLVATGAVAVGDDLIGSIAGGGVVSKISRRFGEGMINGALTARVGIAAIEVCRPMPFQAAAKPKVSGVVSRALKGVF